MTFDTCCTNAIPHVRAKSIKSMIFHLCHRILQQVALKLSSLTSNLNIMSY